jgi:hypothetical protein
VAAVHAVEVTNRYRTSLRQTGVVKAAKYLHGAVIFLIALCGLWNSPQRRFVIKTGYIVTQQSGSIQALGLRQTFAFRVGGF